jgi:hypothetical protein
MVDPRLKAEKVLGELNYNYKAFTIENFVRTIGETKSRAILTIPWKMSGGLFGAWISDGEEPKEYIFYRENVPLIHQVHIQLHELSHFLLGHSTLKIRKDLIVSAIKGVEQMPFNELTLLRSTEKNEIETEAETLASLMQERIIRNSQLDQLTHDLSSDEKMANFLLTLGLNK